jgi:hypothetical protein
MGDASRKRLMEWRRKKRAVGVYPCGGGVRRVVAAIPPGARTYQADIETYNGLIWKNAREGVEHAPG